jgi:hypothetical protein
MEVARLFDKKIIKTMDCANSMLVIDNNMDKSSVKFVLIRSTIRLYFLVWLLGAVVPLIKPFYLKNKYLKSLLLIFSICLVLASVYQKFDYTN